MNAAAPLPYTDTKPVGAADFYTAINATFRFVFRRFGREGLLRYWRDLGTRYYAPVSVRWQEGGMAAVADYWRAFFAAEPGAQAEVTLEDDAVRVCVKVCPAIAHLRAQGREIVPFFCQHCHFVSDAIAQPAGLTVRVSGGNGSCEQRFVKTGAEVAPQRLEDIATAS
ncbi:MAG: hypothetical protein JNG86_16820 [Verrucomicrobiaceae bacterium]|nr:hypothetical protein [Verrucomicrobiaceae bacterium]